VSELLSAAFKALGMDADRREITLVANALRASGDAEVQALLGIWPDDREGWDWLVSIASEAGAGGLVALDLATAFQTPGAFAHPIAPPEREDEWVEDDPA
jgi:hypothetical protein